MHLISLLSVAAVLAGAQAATLHRRVVNGTEAVPQGQPWMVMLRESDDLYPMCGGTLIARDVVLTAAHCLAHYELDDLSMIRAGFLRHDSSKEPEAEGAFEIGARNITLHAGYDGVHGTEDVGLLFLAEEAPAHIPHLELGDIAEVSVDEVLRTFGWGFNYDPDQSLHIPRVRNHRLLYAEVRSTPGPDGTRAWVRTDADRGPKIHARTTRRDQALCYGDSGGALYSPKHNKVYGIMSSIDDCTGASLAYYEPVARQLAWIRERLPASA